MVNMHAVHFSDEALKLSTEPKEYSELSDWQLFLDFDLAVTLSYFRSQEFELIILAVELH